MAFEDDMIEAGYSDEQEYLDSLIDDFEDNYRRQQVEKPRAFDPRGQATVTPRGKIGLTLCGKIKMTP